MNRRSFLVAVLVVTVVGLGWLALRKKKAGLPDAAHRVAPSTVPAPVPAATNSPQVSANFFTKRGKRAAGIVRPEPTRIELPAELKTPGDFLALVPLGAVTHRAVASGPWSDPATWGGQVPGEAARVQIPENIHVTIGDTETSHLKSLRVDGELTIAPQQNAHLLVDTLVINTTGSLVVGGPNNPLPPSADALVSLQAYHSPNDDEVARRQSALMISMGQVLLAGQEKAAHAVFGTTPQVGDRELLLVTPPTNWKSGDLIALGGNRQSREETETLQVKYVTGNKVGLEPVVANPEWKGLTGDYTTRPDQRGFAVNLTRNVALAAPPPEVPTDSPRGSVVFHGSGVAGANLRNVGVYGLGVDDAILRGQSEALNRPALTLQAGPANSPAKFSGVALVDAPEPGIVLDQGRATIANSVAFDANGGALLTPSGAPLRLIWTGERAVPGVLLKGQPVTP